MRNKKSLLSAVLGLLFSVLFGYSAHALEPLQPLLSCKADSSVACIHQIIVETANGERLTTRVSGRVIPETRTYAPESVLKANWDVYDVPDINISGNKGGSFLIRPFYFPKGNRDCFYTPCIEGGEYLEFATAPILHEGKSSFSDLGYTYEVHFQVPENFSMIAANGRGYRKVDIQIDSSDDHPKRTGFINYKLRIEPMVYSGFNLRGVLNGVLIEKAETETDNGAIWFRGTRDPVMQSFGVCKNIYGVTVTGNAFFTGLPRWNSKDQTIDISTSAPHLKSNGEQNFGYFQARISKQMADCLWAVDLSKNVNAQVSLTYTDSKENVQTWSGQMIGDEYVMTVSGIHFSSPTLSFKLSQENTPAPTPVVTATPTPAPISTETPAPVATQTPKPPTAKKFTITCVKGKTVKKVTALKPVCPKGYKKK
jgi:hypothetical protein